MLLTALVRARPAAALAGRPAAHALGATRVRHMAAVPQRRRAHAAPMSMATAGNAGARSAPGTFPETIEGVAELCAESIRAKAPRKLLRAYAHALGDAAAQVTDADAREPTAARGEVEVAAAASAASFALARTDSSLEAIVVALIKAERADLAAEAFSAYARAHGGAPPLAAGWALAAGRLLRALCRAGDTPGAQRVWAVVDAVRAGELPIGGTARLAELAAGALPSLACALLRDGDVPSALALVRTLPPTGPACAERSYAELLRWFGKAASFEGVLATLNAMRGAGARPGTLVLDQLASATVKQVDFVTGAVSMATLPRAVLPEVAFIGRSNVGKSSLVNMALGRRALAYASNTPGKTQQFNFFDVNRGAAPGHAQFSLADLPGVGFAKVPAAVRAGWTALLGDYFSNRPTLVLLCHLVDGNVGPKAADVELMHTVSRSIASGGFSGRYAIVLTKLDKPIGRKELSRTLLLAQQAASAPAQNGEDELSGGELPQFCVPERVTREVRAALRDAGLADDTPVLATSAKSKLGRDDLWTLLGDALIGRMARADDVPRAPRAAAAAPVAVRGARGGRSASPRGAGAGAVDVKAASAAPTRAAPSKRRREPGAGA
ncbi:hypothetical protein KFE25_000397 [Diacronema lutheri]|uniref:EngB-type G domain-containing protein n=1 Tax=Diacronema lutheri TaxID=2081491 RepID=A0A8J5XE68_DIALT|nr:hypothetical protein KFE25_000397 [Diacronema lutheri]